MTLTQEQQAFYEATRDRCRVELMVINRTITDEVQRVKALLSDLGTQRKALMQMYGGACDALGQPNDMTDELGDMEF